MTSVRHMSKEKLTEASAGTLTEPQLHSHITNHLADSHLLAKRQVSCERCETILHLHSNNCMRTWVETGNGNYCLYCFVVVAGGVAPSHATRLAGGDCLPRNFGLERDSRPQETGRAGFAQADA